MAEDNLVREVDEAIRQDQMMALWRYYRKPLIAAAAALIIATTGSVIWQRYEEQRAGVTMHAMLRAHAAFEDGNYGRAVEGFETAEEEASTAAARDLAQLWQARALEEAGRTEEAIAVLQPLANRPAGDDLLWRDLACLRLVALDEARNDCLQAGESPLAAERRQWLAAHYTQQGEVEKARTTLTRLSRDAAASDAVRRQAADMLATLPPATEPAQE